MEYVTYRNLELSGFIIIEINSGVPEVTNKPEKEKWNGKIIVLDFDRPEEDSPGYTKITIKDGTMLDCLYSEW